MNHHLHNFIWGLLFSASPWNYANYYPSYLPASSTCRPLFLFFSQESLLRSGSRRWGRAKRSLGGGDVGLEGGTRCFRRGSPSWEPGQEMCSRTPDVPGAASCPGAHLAPTRAPLASSRRRKKPHALFKGLWMMPGRAVSAPWGPGKVLARGRWRWQHGGAAPTRALREHVLGGLGSSWCCSPQCLCQERRLCSPAVTLPPSRGSPSAFCLPLAPRCAQCGGQKIPCTHVRSCSIPQSSLHRPQEGADRGTSALGDAPVQASGSQGSVISTQLDQELHWGGVLGLFILFFFQTMLGEKSPGKGRALKGTHRSGASLCPLPRAVLL